MAKTIYEKSNEITSVRLNSFSKVYAHEVLSSLESSCDREENAQILLDYLCKKFKIERVTLSVTPAARPCNRRNTQTYGCYTQQADVLLYIIQRLRLRRQLQ